MNIKKSTKKAQAATEFIMTYGWAMLIVVTGMGAFLYLQINPNQIVSPICSFTDTVNCVAHTATENEIKMEIVNMLGQKIEITNVVCTIQTEDYDSTTTYTLNPGEQKVINCDIRSGNFQQKQTIKADTNIYYLQDGQVFPKATEGQIIVTILN